MRLCTLALLLTASLLHADQLTLKNGDRLTGKVTAGDDKTLTLKTTYAGDIKIARAEIVSLTMDEPLNITLAGAPKVVAKLATADGETKLVKPDGTAQPIKPDAIAALRDDAAQRAWEREQERLHHARLTDFWAGFVSLGIANASGNASTTTISTAASATRIAGKNKIAVNFAQIYATQSTTVPYGTTANRIGGALRLDRDISGRLFAYGVNAYDYDRFLNLDLRVVAGGGFGYHAYKSKKAFLDLSGGGNWNRETYDISPSAGPYLSMTRNSGEISFGQESGVQLFERLKLSERLGVFPNLTQTGEYRMTLDTTMSIPVKRWFEFNIGFGSRYQSNPPLGKKTNDTILTTGIRLSFDQNKR